MYTSACPHVQLVYFARAGSCPEPISAFNSLVISLLFIYLFHVFFLFVCSKFYAYCSAAHLTKGTETLSSS